MTSRVLRPGWCVARIYKRKAPPLKREKISTHVPFYVINLAQELLHYRTIYLLAIPIIKDLIDIQIELAVSHFTLRLLHARWRSFLLVLLCCFYFELRCKSHDYLGYFTYFEVFHFLGNLPILLYGHSN